MPGGAVSQPARSRSGRKAPIKGKTRLIWQNVLTSRGMNATPF
jgi:hypothetical protein